MKATVCVYWCASDPKPEYNFSNYPMWDCGAEYQRLGELEIEIPWELPSPATMAMVRVGKLRQMQGEHQAAITQLEAQIQELLALPGSLG